MSAAKGLRWPWVRRSAARRSERRLQGTVDAFSARMETTDTAMSNVRVLLTKYCKEHTPYPGAWADPGNSFANAEQLTRVEFWCRKCRRPWPCEPWRQFRLLYMYTYGAENLKIEPEYDVALKLRKVQDAPVGQG